MRILRVAQKVYPDVKGGGAYHVHAMSRDQAAMGHDVTMLTVRQDPSLPQRETRDGYTIHRCDAPLTLLGNDISVGVARRLWDDSVDVMHAHSHLYFSTNLAALRRRLGGPPLAITNHGLYSQTAPEWLFDAYVRTLGRLTFDSAEVVFCYTDADKERLRAKGVSTDIAVVRNGIDHERFSSSGPESDRLNESEPAVLFVGRLVEGKRPGDAIAAFERVVASHPDAQLYFVGEGPLRASLESTIADAGLTDRVSFLGHVPYEEMPAIYRAADLLVLPSRAEGLPRTTMEALATETPVVTSDLPQLREVTEHGGIAVAVGDVAALADAIEHLLTEDGRCRDLGREGRRFVEEAYSWADTVEKTTERLSSLLD